jgi:hypothetical protein
MLPYETGSERAPGGGWPDHGHRTTHDGGEKDRAEGAAVRGLRPVVAEYEHLPCADRDRAGGIPTAVEGREVEVWFGERIPVDVDLTGPHFNGFAREAHHPLDEFTAALVGLVVEDDDVPAGDVAQTTGDLLDDDTVVLVQGLLHRGAGYVELLDEKGPDQQQTEQADEQ